MYLNIDFKNKLPIYFLLSYSPVYEAASQLG